MKSQTTICSYDQRDENEYKMHSNVFRTFKRGFKDQLRNPESSTNYSSSIKNSTAKQQTNQKKTNHQTNKQIIINPFNPYELTPTNNSFDELYRNQVSDRFIPTRKFIHREASSMHQENDGKNQHLSTPAVDPHHFTASEIYKRFIMAEDNTESNDGLIQMYKNQNFFKFAKTHQAGTSVLIQNPDLSSKKSEFDFTQKLLKTTIAKRKINKLPFKVLDAPALQDDFYLNLIDWSSQNFLAVGLSSNVYLWNGNNSKVTKLCDLGLSDTVTAVGWSLKGPNFTLGTNNGQLHQWDLNKMKRVRVLGGHTDRIASIAWNSQTISTGSRDKTILHRDPRCKGSYYAKLTHHKQQVCGLKWSPDEQQLCSGGNDNKLYIWNQKSSQPVAKYSDHVAAVKAVAWSPHQHGLLLSGGGTADKTIKFRNTLQGTTIKSLDTGSQVCNLIFSKTLNEFVSTHGYSLNQINVWKYPKMEKISTLTGHTFRVLYLAMSPDGSTIVTGAGDQTLRFWKVFPGRNQLGKLQSSVLNINNINIR